MAAGATDPNAIGKHLIAAARLGNVDRVRELLAAGAPLAFREPPIDRSALQWAVKEKHPAVVAVLLEAGTLRRESPEEQGELVVRAVYWRQPGILQALLDHGASVDADDQYRTALGQAAEKGFVELARLLLDAGADPTRDVGAGSALVFALRAGNAEMIALLRAAGSAKTYGGQRVEDLRGVPTLQTNDIMLLVRGTVEEAAQAFAAARGGAARWDRAIFGHDVELSPLCYLVFQLRGHSWAIIKELRSDTCHGGVNVSDAEDVSRQTANRVIYLGISKTAESYGYDLYEAGERLEHFGSGDGYGDGDPNDEEANTWGFQFDSQFRTIDSAAIGDTHEFMDHFVAEQGAYASPMGGGLFSMFAGLTPTLTFTAAGMEAEDFERVDIVHLPPDAYSRRIKTALAQRRGPDESAARRA